MIIIIPAGDVVDAWYIKRVRTTTPFSCTSEEKGSTDFVVETKDMFRDTKQIRDKVTGMPP